MGEPLSPISPTASPQWRRAGYRFWLQTRQGRHALVEAEAERLGLRVVEQVRGWSSRQLS